MVVIITLFVLVGGILFVLAGHTFSWFETSVVVVLLGILFVLDEIRKGMYS